MVISPWDPLCEWFQDLRLVKYVQQVQSLVEKCDLCQWYAKEVDLLEEWRVNPSSQRLQNSISGDLLQMPVSEQLHVASINFQDSLSHFEIFIPVKKRKRDQTAFQLFNDIILDFRKPNIIPPDKKPGFVGETVAPGEILALIRANCSW